MQTSTLQNPNISLHFLANKPMNIVLLKWCFFFMPALFFFFFVFFVSLWQVIPSGEQKHNLLVFGLWRRVKGWQDRCLPRCSQQHNRVPALKIHQNWTSPRHILKSRACNNILNCINTAAPINYLSMSPKWLIRLEVTAQPKNHFCLLIGC